MKAGRYGLNTRAEAGSQAREPQFESCELPWSRGDEPHAVIRISTESNPHESVGTDMWTLSPAKCQVLEALLLNRTGVLT